MEYIARVETIRDGWVQHSKSHAFDTSQAWPETHVSLCGKLDAEGRRDIELHGNHPECKACQKLVRS